MTNTKSLCSLAIILFLFVIANNGYSQQNTFPVPTGRSGVGSFFPGPPATLPLDLFHVKGFPFGSYPYTLPAMRLSIDRGDLNDPYLQFAIETNPSTINMFSVLSHNTGDAVIRVTNWLGDWFNPVPYTGQKALTQDLILTNQSVLNGSIIFGTTVPQNLAAGALLTQPPQELERMRIWGNGVVQIKDLISGINTSTLSDPNWKLQVAGDVFLDQGGLYHHKLRWSAGNTAPEHDEHWIGFSPSDNSNHIPSDALPVESDWWMKFTSNANEGFIFRTKYDSDLVRIYGGWNVASDTLHDTTIEADPGGARTIFKNRVLIGTTNPGLNPNNLAYMLAVNGSIKAKELIIDETKWKQDFWPDYVFDKSYSLPKLGEVESYIQANKHLPGIPSAKDISEKGLNIAEMQKHHMEKIEELTLYIIALEKENKTILARLEKLENNH